MMSLEIQSSRARASYKDNDNKNNNSNNNNNNNNNKKKRNKVTTKDNREGLKPFNNNNRKKGDSSSVTNCNKTNSNNNSCDSNCSNCSNCSVNLVNNFHSNLYQRAVFELLQTVNDLEHSLIEDHQQDYKLRMALERQAENVYDLRTSLLNEKARNERLIGLLENVNSSTPTDDEYYEGCDEKLSSNYNSLNKAYGSISPLLMQQRYDELSISYKQCRHQLIKKEKQLTLCNCEKEMSQAKYDQLMDEYRLAQRRFEGLCSRYLRLQKRKNYEIQQLREALTYASDCVIGAQQIVDNCPDCHTNEQATKEFNQNLQLFIKSLQLCQWNQCQCTSLSSQSK